MPSKPDKYGIKIWTLCDSHNGYCLNFEVYTEKGQGGNPEQKKGLRVVKQLTEFLPAGYNITTDNFFPSVELAETLLKRPNSMTLLGTMRKNKKEIPDEFLNLQNRSEFDSKFGFTKDMTRFRHDKTSQMCCSFIIPAS